MNNFECEKCKTLILDSPRGYITGCEHYPLQELKSHPRNKRKDMLSILAELAREENPVTRWSKKEIIKSRIDRGDIS